MLFNKVRAIKTMDILGVDAIITTTPENVTYMCDYYSWKLWVYRGMSPTKGLQACVIFPRNGEPVIIIPKSEHPSLTQYGTWIPKVKTYGRMITKLMPGTSKENLRDEERKLWVEEKPGDSSYSKYEDALVDSIKELGLTSGVIALEHFGMSPDAQNALTGNFPSMKLEEASDMLRYIRAVKTPDEIEKLRAVNLVNEKAMMEVLRNAREGITEKELCQIHKETVAKYGARQEFYNSPAGSRGGGFFPPADYALKKGDVLMVDAGCILDEYHSDCGVNGVVGGPSEDDRKFYSACAEAIEKGIEKLVPGLHPSEVVGAMDKVLIKHGLEPGFTTYAHGTGLEVRDLPVASLWDRIKGQNNKINLGDMLLEPGMVVNIEAPLILFNRAMYQLEHTILLTENGNEMLVDQQRKLYTLPLEL